MTSIEINPETTLSDIQKIFSRAFPFLKLEFFTKPHAVNEGSNKKDLVTDTDKKVGALSSMALDIVLVVHRNMPVLELEKLFETKLHLHIQVFSKSGNIWLESIQTDGHSLEQLNEQAKTRSTELVEKEEPGDYHEQE